MSPCEAIPHGISQYLVSLFVAYVIMMWSTRRFGIVIHRSAAVYIGSVGNLVNSQKKTGVLRCSNSTMRTFLEDGVYTQMWDGVK